MNTNIKSDKLSVLIVGCGSIAGGFDKDRKRNELPYTHAFGYICDGRFKISACVDPNEVKRIEFMAKWNIPLGFSSIDELLNLNYKFDVISICSPTIHHLLDIEVALQLNPKLIFCEKPLTSSLADSERLVASCKAANVMMMVNYTRRWDPNILDLRANLLLNQFGELRSIVGFYNKGILNNGSHMFDLLSFLFGDIEVIGVGKAVNDYSNEDQTAPVWLETEKGIPIYLCCAHAKDYAFFELQLIFSAAVLTMEEGGFFWRKRSVEKSDTFKGYSKLDDGQRWEGGYSKAMTKAIDNIYQAIIGGSPLISSGQSALLAQKISEKVKFMLNAQNSVYTKKIN